MRGLYEDAKGERRQSGGIEEVVTQRPSKASDWLASGGGAGRGEQVSGVEKGTRSRTLQNGSWRNYRWGRTHGEEGKKRQKAQKGA